MAITDSRSSTSPPERSGLAKAFFDARIRSIVFQILTLAGVIGFFWWLVDNTITNLAARSLSAGFGFLDVSAGFGIGFTLISYTEGDTYLRVFAVGILNTLLVAVVSIVFATILGLLVGLARLSTNWIISGVARAYVELLRNTPLLLQIIAWYFGVFNLLPRPRDSVVLVEGFMLNNRGFYMPGPVPQDGWGLVVAAFVLALIGAITLYKYEEARRDRTGKSFPAISSGIAMVILVPMVVFLATGSPMEWTMPVLQGFNLVGGISVPPSFCALIVALSAYTSCFIAEIVRSGIQSVGKGQLEAAGALNLPANWTLRRVVLPQAMRVIIPPLISQYLNVTKNSSLAIAIGFPDLVSVWMNTSLNQSGRAIPIVAMTMAFYCIVSLSVSLVMNRYNRSVQLKER
ncbi:amino acid ABC transporter permease [Roseicyclus mahoneyensis]|uniref:Amino acid ABC transporter membrane protein 1 (PAAT family) n=1 Tax=Roseicyclus mahoneyensis TaxID=164332 RepID=A0A316GDW8_9RHOB|nr:amino acid ABC transporter permease [Roseicyclus mahoneyensis]PWK58126.1 amino acid ABC transporter membrane protein 1 (PAAT family) [Roseicyclus mahoneyensis]